MLSSANVYGYLKCAKDQRKKISQFAGSFLVNAVMH